MGFGILFFGYFLLLNITYFEFTDVIAGLVMAYALFKISSVSKYFKLPLYLAIAFSVFGLGELALGGLDLFRIISLDGMMNYISIVRDVLLCLFTVVLLRAMIEIGKDLDVTGLPLKCAALNIWAVIFYVAEICFNTGFLAPLIPSEALNIIYLVLIVGSLMLPIAVLTAIFSCYRWICLPEDLEKEMQSASQTENGGKKKGKK